MPLGMPNRENEDSMIETAGALIGLTPSLVTASASAAEIRFILEHNFYMTLRSLLERGEWNFAMDCHKLIFNVKENAWELPHGFVRGVSINNIRYDHALEEMNLEERRRGFLFSEGCCCIGDYHCKDLCLTYVSSREDAIAFTDNFKMAAIYRAASLTAVLAGRSFNEALRLGMEADRFLNWAHNLNSNQKPANRMITGGDCGCGC